MAQASEATRPAADVPALPAFVHTALGPIPVERVSELKDVETGEELFGYVNLHLRRISIRTELDPRAAWATLFHEQVHLWLHDAGLELGKDEERVCDVIGTAMAVAYLSR